MFQHLIDNPGLQILVSIIACVICMVFGWVLCHMNHDKTLLDYDNGLTIEARELPPVYPNTETTIRALTQIGDIKNYPSTYLLNKHEVVIAENKTYVVATEKVAEINFIQRNTESQMDDGILDEQLARVLLDRAERHFVSNNSAYHQRQVDALKEYLDACKEVQNDVGYLW